MNNENPRQPPPSYPGGTGQHDARVYPAPGGTGQYAYPQYANGQPPADGYNGQFNYANYGKYGATGYGQPASGYGQPAAAGYGQPAAAGYGQPAATGYGYGQAATGGYGQPAAAAYGQPAAASYGQPGTAYGPQGYYGVGGPAPRANLPPDAAASQLTAAQQQQRRGHHHPSYVHYQQHHLGESLSAMQKRTPVPGSAQDPNRVLSALQNMFPNAPDATLTAAMRSRRTVEGATHWIREMIQKGLLRQDGSPTSAQAEYQVQMPKSRSIRDKYNGAARTQIPQTGPTPQYGWSQPAAMGPHAAMGYQQFPSAPMVRPTGPPPRKIVRKYGADEDGGYMPSSDEEDMQDGSWDQQSTAEFETRVLNFLNTSDADGIMDVSGCTSEMAAALIKKRPYQTLAQASKVDLPGSNTSRINAETGKRKRGAIPKTAGSKIVDASLATLHGYEAVDSLIHECANLAKVVRRGTTAWGIDLKHLDKLDLDQITTPRGGFFKEKPQLLASDVELKGYQQVGINWLRMLYDKRLSCILADEMGLGKTCQIIAFLAHLKEVGQPGPHLVVCPSSTLENWLREFQRFCPSLVVEPYYGNQPERAEMREAIASSRGQWDVLVTTYNLATGGKSDMSFLKNMGFNVCVYDEGHLLKNSQSERYNKLMRIQARFRVLLTGTPLQNNLRELVSLLSFILPRKFEQNKDDLLEVFKFKAKTSTSNPTGEDGTPAPEAEKERSQLLSEQRIIKAKTMMAPFVLRRRKEQVLQHLPPKVHESVHCDMTPRQTDLYKREFARNKHGLQDATTVKAEASEQKPAKKSREEAKVLDNVLMQLRKAALHPLLFRTVYTDKLLRQMSGEIMNEDTYKQANREYIFEDMSVMNDFELDRLCRQFPVTIGGHVLDEQEYMNSGKVQKLAELLPAMKAKGDRVLLFSQFTQILDILEKVLGNLGFKFLRMDGQTPVETRQDMIDRFQEEDTIDVFLLSTKAGGFGINLACANVVIIFDPSFNPHDDKQAEDRAHRVGQTRPVRVVRMITRSSIEENIMQLANTKLALDKHVSADEDQIDAESEALVADWVLKDAPPSTAGSEPQTPAPGASADAGAEARNEPGTEAADKLSEAKEPPIPAKPEPVETVDLGNTAPQSSADGATTEKDPEEEGIEEASEPSPPPTRTRAIPESDEDEYEDVDDDDDSDEDFEDE